MLLLDTALDYLLSVVTENEEVKKFPKDFVTASMQWIRSWFLIDDPVSTSIVDNAAMPEVAKKAVLEAKLNTLKDNPEFMKELEAKVQAFSVQRERIKNVVSDANIDVAGKIHIGDSGTSASDNYDQKNVIKGGTFKSGGDFHLGDDVK
jgi:hypothetical protein